MRGGVLAVGLTAVILVLVMPTSAAAGSAAAGSVTWTAPFTSAHWILSLNSTAHTGSSRSTTLISPAFSTRTGLGAVGYNSTVTGSGSAARSAQVFLVLPVNSSGPGNFTAVVGGRAVANWGLTPGTCGLNSSRYDYCTGGAAADAWFELYLFDLSLSGYAAASAVFMPVYVATEANGVCSHGSCSNTTFPPFHGSTKVSFAGQLWLNATLNPRHTYLLFLGWEADTADELSAYRATLTGAAAASSISFFPSVTSVSQF